MIATVIAACELGGGVWLALLFSSHVTDKLVCIANNILMIDDINATAVDSLLGGNIEGIAAVQDIINTLPQNTVDFALNYLSLLGVGLAVPGFIAVLFLLAAIWFSTRKQGTCCTNMMLVLHGLFAIIAFAISLVAAFGSHLAHHNDFFIEQRDTFEASCDEMKSDLRHTIGNLTVAIRQGEAHEQDVSELRDARDTAINVQSIVNELCRCFLEFIDSLGLLSSAGIFSSIVYLIAIVVGCAGCCCLANKKAMKKDEVKLSNALVEP